MDIKSIKKRIEQLCNQKQWSFYRLAKESGFQQSTLESIINEKNMPSLYTLEKICLAFNITLSDFFDSEFFRYTPNLKEHYVELWKELSKSDKKKVLIYMHGLLHKEIKKEDFQNDI